MLVVLTVLGLLGALVLAYGPVHSTGLGMRLASDTVAQALRLARTQAMARNSMTMIVFDTAASEMRLNDGVARRLPVGLSVRVTTRADEIAGPRGAILFLPDGSSSGGQVELAGNGQRSAVVVNWLTGQVSIVAGGGMTGATLAVR